jgi:hypothetical protein
MKIKILYLRTLNGLTNNCKYSVMDLDNFRFSQQSFVEDKLLLKFKIERGKLL